MMRGRAWAATFSSTLRIEGGFETDCQGFHGGAVAVVGGIRRRDLRTGRCGHGVVAEGLQKLELPEAGGGDLGVLGRARRTARRRLTLGPIEACVRRIAAAT